MSLTQLSPPWPVFVEGRGAGYAMAVIDYSQEHHLLFVVAMDATGEIWAVANPDVRLQWNPSMGRVAGKVCPPTPRAPTNQESVSPMAMPGRTVWPTSPIPTAEESARHHAAQSLATGLDLVGPLARSSGLTRADHHPADGVTLEIRVRPNGPLGYSEWESRCADHPELDGFRDEVLSHLLRRLADVKISGFPSVRVKEVGRG